MTTRFSVSILPFLVGGFALCGGYFLQALLFSLPQTPAMYLLPFCLGGLGGLVLDNRAQRIKTLEQTLLQADSRRQDQRTESDAQYHRLFALNPAAQLLIDPANGRIIKANPPAERFYGYSAAILAEKTIFDLSAAAPEFLETMIRQVLAEEQHRLPFQHRLHSGETREMDVCTLPVSLQGRTLLHSVVTDITAGSEAEAKLRRKGLEQRLLLDSIPISIWYLRDPETLGMVNKAFADHVGLSPKELAHRRLEAVFHDEMLTLALADNRQVFNEKKALTFERWLHAGTNQPRYMAITKTPKLDDAGKVEFVVCTATDITKVQQARELLQIERDLRLALDAAASQDETLQICLAKALEVSQTDCGALYLVDRADGSLTLTAHQGFSSLFIENVCQYNGASGQAQLVQANQPVYGCQADLAGQDLPLADEGVLAMGIVPISFHGQVIACLQVGSHQMATMPLFNRAALETMATHIGSFLVHKEQERQIHQHQQNLEILFNTIQDFVFILDNNGTIIHLNAAAASRLAYQREALIGQNIEVLHPQEHRQQAMESIAAVLAGKNDHCPVPLRSKNGELIPVETHVTSGQWSGHRVIFCLSRDISSRLQLERQQQLLLKNEGLERMAGAMAHHFNNLMTIVAGNLELAHENIAPASETDRLLTHALIGCNRAIELGHTLLIYTGQFAESLASLDLSVFCRDQLASGFIKPAIHQVLTVDLAEPGPRVMADPRHLGQVLASLLTNAMETIDKEPGQITLRVRSLARESLRCPHTFPSGWKPSAQRYGCLEIIDNGTGIDETQMINIFDPFYSDKFLGRGLGLPLALSIVKKLHGAITVASQVNQGTTFRVLLPEQDSTASPA